MNPSEIVRRINNIARFGTVTETKSADGKALARVKVGERVSDFLPVMSFSNSFKKHWIPVRPKEQVLVLSPFGEANGGVVMRSIFNRSAKEPTGANDTMEIVEYEDGTRLSYDTEAKELKIDAAGKITIVCKSASIYADNVDITAATSNTGDVTITGAVSITGALSVTGDISTDASISDSKGSLTGHVHTGVTSGGSNTGTRP